MNTTTQPLRVIPRIENGSAVLFVLDSPAHQGCITCYAHIGQHSDASLDYYRDTKAPRSPEHVEACNALVREYASLGPKEDRVPVVIRKRLRYDDLQAIWSR